jgi:hypothetical protein
MLLSQLLFALKMLVVFPVLMVLYLFVSFGDTDTVRTDMSQQQINAVSAQEGCAPGWVGSFCDSRVLPN